MSKSWRVCFTYKQQVPRGRDQPIPSGTPTLPRETDVLSVRTARPQESIAANGTTVLETDVLNSLAPISTPGGTNQGAFRGISRSQGDIRFLRLTGDFITTHTLEVGQAAAVPEPSALVLIFGGLCLIYLARQRRHRNVG